MIPLTKEFESLLESLPVMVWTKGKEGRQEYFNHRWVEYTGIPEGNHEWDWTDLIHPKDHDQAVTLWDESLKTGHVFEFEYRLKRYDGTYRWHVSKAIPIFNNDHEIYIWVGICTDVHDNKNKEQELARKNKELLQMNTDLENFVYTASHDLKAPISNVEGLVNALKDDTCYKVESENKELLSLIDKSVHKLKTIIKDLTEISKVQREINDDVRVVSISDTLNEVSADMDKIIEESGVIVCRNIQADKLEFSKRNLRSIIYNLLSNAIKFRSPDRVPEVTISTYRQDQYLVLSVQDNGIGIDLSKGDKLFLMFKRMNSHIEGAGVGLYIVKRIIENNGGKIEVESAIEKGSVFRVYFKF